MRLRLAHRAPFLGSRALGVALVCAVALGVVVTANATAPAAATRFTVTSTLDGRKVLPVRIHWLAHPTLPKSKIAEVDFLIDGRLAFVEHIAPYTYGRDGNYLVTSFLRPGVHAFTVKAVTKTKKVATNTVRARVLPAPAPPAALAGTWSREITSGDAGTWKITINSIGWLFDDPHGGGQNQDVSYPAPGQVLIRAAIEEPPFGGYKRGGAFCNEEPDPSVLYGYAVASDNSTLTLTPIGSPDDCRRDLLQGVWTHVSS